MRIRDSPERRHSQAKRIHNHYRAEADKMVADFRDNDEFIKRLSEVVRRKAIGGRILKIGIYRR